MSRLRRFGSEPDMAIVFFGVLVVYALSLPRTITLEDAGLFQMVCHLDGIAHPPGYPLFTAICQEFVRIPVFPEGVFAGNFLSALFAAGACSVLYSCVREITGDRLTAMISASSYGFSATFWSQAIIIEVYALAVLMFLLCWRSLLAYCHSQRNVWLYLAIFLFSLALTNHWPLMLLASPALLVTLLPCRENLVAVLRTPVFWVLAGLLVLAGLSPYLLLLRSHVPVALYGDVRSLSELFNYVARTQYTDHQVLADNMDRFRYMLWVLKESGHQFGLAGLPVMLFGVVVAIRKYGHSVNIAMLLIFLSATLLLNLLINFQYDFFWRAVFKPYPVISYVALAFWFSAGASDLLNRIADRAGGRAGLVRSGLAIMLVLSVLAGNVTVNNRSGNEWVERYGRQVLESLPSRAVFFARGDFEVGLFGYLHLVAGVRPDIELRSWNHLVFDNRLASPYAPEVVQERARTEFLAETDRPVFASSAPLSPVAQMGAYYRYTPGQPRSVERNPGLDPLLEYLLAIYSQGLVDDPHELHFIYHRLLSFTRQYVGLALTRNDLSADEHRRLNWLQSTFPGKLATLETLLHLNTGNKGKDVLLDMAMAAEQQITDFIPVDSLAVFHEFYGRIENMAPADAKEAIAHFEKSVALYRDPRNTSLCPLMRLYRQHSLDAKMEALLAEFPGLDCP